jgi:parvulin-like peptidyl-prolyl isomerase
MQRAIAIQYLSGLMLISMSGCAGSQPQSLSSSAFEPAGPIARLVPQPRQTPPRVASAAPTTQASPVETLVVLDSPATQPTTAPTALQGGQYNTLGGVVAQVNGTPIYADTLVRLQGPMLSTRAPMMDELEFRGFVRQNLLQAREVAISEEAQYAMAMLHLSDDDKKLAEAIIMQRRQQSITEAGGSLELAKRKAVAAGTTFDDAMQDLKRKIIFSLYLRKMIEPRIQVSAADLRKYYNANLDKLYTVKEQAQFRVIKIDPARIGGADAKAAAMKRITAIRDRAQNGEDFATLASTENQDDYLKKNAGDPGGWMQRDSYRIDAVDNAVWKLQPGQVSPVINTEDAFFIVKLEAKKSGRVEPFEAMQDQIEAKLIDDQKKALMEKLMTDDGLDIVRNEKMLETAVDMAMQEYPRWSKKETADVAH